jgi:hypothetical protein
MTTLDIQLYDKVDENDDLELYHFNYDYDYGDANLKLKGIVIDKHTKEVVCSTSLHTIEYDVENLEYIPNIKEIDWQKSTVILSHEGCFLRVFNHNGVWYISTHRKLDADNSRWGSKHSFKILFISALMDNYGENFDIDVDFFDKLDKNLIYTFLLRNDQTNRIVCNAPSKNESKIYFTGTFEKGNNHNYIPILSDDDDTFLNIKVSHTIPVKNVTDITQFVGNQSYKHHQGIIVFTQLGDKTQIFKIMCPKYLEYKEIRNNCSNLLYRYAQLRCNDASREKIIELFPYFSYDFFQFENTLSKIAIYITNQYINRFLKKQYAAVTPLQYKITKKLREWYLQSPSQNYINPEVVLQFINRESSLYVYKLVTEFNANK